MNSKTNGRSRKAYWRRWGIRRMIDRRKEQLRYEVFRLAEVQDQAYSFDLIRDYLDRITEVSMFRFTRRKFWR